MTEEELTRLEALATAATAGPCERCTHAKATQCDGDDGRDGCPCACHGKLRLARVIYEGEAVRSVPALVAEVRRLKILEPLLEDDDRAIRRLRDKLSEQAATELANAALAARLDAAERAAETARAEEREACARIARDLAEQERAMVAWLREQGLPTADARARYDAADLIERQIRARGGDRG